jgi:methylmalonyl-CoA/ethylmalonyl-CoA epimerase
MKNQGQVLFKKLDHIGIAVRNIENSLNVYKHLGLKVSHIEAVAEQFVKVAFISLGEGNIELLEPTSDKSPIYKFLEKKGEGLHHIAFEVTNLIEMVEKMKEGGISFITESPLKGAHNKSVIFIHPKSTNSVLIELTQNIA